MKGDEGHGDVDLRQLEGRAELLREDRARGPDRLGGLPEEARWPLGLSGPNRPPTGGPPTERPIRRRG